MTDTQEWVRWQRAHTEALHMLQEAQRAYHRTLGAGAFTGHDGSASDPRKDALLIVDLARIRLDEVHARQPRSGPSERQG